MRRGRLTSRGKCLGLAFFVAKKEGERQAEELAFFVTKDEEVNRTSWQVCPQSKRGSVRKEGKPHLTSARSEDCHDPVPCALWYLSLILREIAECEDAKVRNSEPSNEAAAIENTIPGGD